MYAVKLTNVLTLLLVFNGKSSKATLEKGLVCEGDTLELQCKNGELLRIIFANYGSTDSEEKLCPNSGVDDCVEESSLDVIKTKCEDRISCSVKASNIIFGDPCPNKHKYLEVKYECVKADLVCEGGTMSLNCQDGKFLKIISASYGRRVSDKNDCPNSKILKDCISKKSLDIMKSTCEDRDSCSIKASNSIFGDPCPNAHKYLKVEYDCVLPACGQRFVQQNVKIVGGVDALYGAYPWQAGVLKKADSGQYGHFCGGTIINDQWIISAVHCYYGEKKENFRVRVGDLDNEKPDQYEQEFEVEELYMHESYNANTSDYDMALLKVKPNPQGKIQFSEKVQPACLPSPNEVYVEGKMCMISGWGDTWFASHNFPSHLQVAVVPLMLNTVCKRLYAGRGVVTDNMICAGYVKGKIDSCQGDSGGPLVCEINGKNTLMGVTSWGTGCAWPYSPGVYARVTQFLTWIQNKIEASQGSKSRGMPRSRNGKNGNTNKTDNRKNQGNTKKPKKRKNPKNKNNRKNKKKN